MNVVQSAKKPPTSALISKAGVNQHEDDHIALSFYEDVPEMELTLDQFEVYALKRLKVE